VVRDDRGLIAVNGVTLDVRAGEIMALAGVQGNGQTELVEAIAGMRRVESGSISLNGRDITNASPRAVLDAGLGHIPEDRQRDGLVMSMSVADNLVLNTPRRAPYARRGSRNLAAVNANAERLVKDFDIRTSSTQELVSSLVVRSTFAASASWPPATSAGSASRLHRFGPASRRCRVAINKR